jgi:putative Mg2+ transporter-C (MgtC) family protein
MALLVRRMTVDIETYLYWLLHLVTAIVLAIPTAWNREIGSRALGLRTFPLVSLGACAYVLIGKTFIGADDADAMARLLQGLMTGIGFIGGGAILKHDDRVSGTADAASIWITGALGAAVAFELWALAILLSLLNFLLLYLLDRLKPVANGD